MFGGVMVLFFRQSLELRDRSYEVWLEGTDPSEAPYGDYVHLKLGIRKAEGYAEPFSREIELRIRQDGLDFKRDGFVTRSIDLQEEDQEERTDDIVAESLDDQAIEAIIDGIPAFDPILGCLIRGSLSVIAGQIIRCWFATRNQPDWRLRRQEIWDCLSRNGVAMLTAFLARFGRCLIAG